MRAVRLLEVLAVALAVPLVMGGVASALDINIAPMPNAEVGTPYSFAFDAEEGCLPYRFSFSSGELPPGLVIDPVDGLIGTPTRAGTFRFYVQADGSPDCESSAVPSQGQFTLEVKPDLAVATASLDPLTTGQPLSIQLQSVGQEEGIRVVWSAIGALPPGVAFSPSGVVSGTPTASGTWGVTFRVEEPFQRWGERQLTFDVADALKVTAPTGKRGEAGVPLIITPQVSGGRPPFAWRTAGSTLPKGLSLDPKAGAISGTPTRSTQVSLLLEAVDARGVTSGTTIAFDIVRALRLTPRPVDFLKAGTRVNLQVGTIGGSGKVRFSVASGALPAGTRLDRLTGRIVGTPRTPGTSTVTIQARDTLKGSTTRTYRFRVVR